MATHTTTYLNYLICLNPQQKEDLGELRRWENLMMASDENKIWIKGFSEEQMESHWVKSIPFVQRFYEKDGKLFPYGSTLPEGNVPSLLWTAIRRALRITLPSFNHNYFGIQEKIKLQLVPSETEQPAVALQTSLETLEKYIEQAPSIRLQHLTWTLLNDKEALVLGTPLLPLQGKVFWQNKTFLIPVGYDFDVFALTPVLQEKINPQADAYILWQEDSSCFYIDKQKLKALSIASFRLTLKALKEEEG